MPRRALAVVALGGNALLQRREAPSLEAQVRNVARAAPALAGLARDRRLVVTHGNGPQVGHILLRSEMAARKAYPLTLDVAVAESEGELGYLLQQALQNELRARVVSILTQVVVSPRDPAFRDPMKPIGPMLDERAARAARRKGVTLARDGDGWRRVVPSPRPREVVEAEAVRRLLGAGFVVVAAGGGGVPVVRKRGRLAGVEAVVDKDHASAVLALDVGATELYLLTDVDGVYLGFGTPRARRVDRLSASEARRLLRGGEFPAGSMGPKVEAAIDFVTRRRGARAVIGSLWDARGGTGRDGRSAGVRRGAAR